MQGTKICTHIKVSGIRCSSPSLRGERFCYYHQRIHRGVLTPPQARLHPIALIEDRESIQAALMEVINALMHNTLDMKRAALLLRALHIAVKNVGHTGFKARPASMVTEIPEYAEPEGSRVSYGVPDLEMPFDAVFGQDPRAAKPHRSYKTPEEFARDRDEQIANYYGYPTAAAHAAAKKAAAEPLSGAPKTQVATHAPAHAAPSSTGDARGTPGLASVARPGIPAAAARVAPAPPARGGADAPPGVPRVSPVLRDPGFRLPQPV